MPKIDLSSVPAKTGSTYPAPHCEGFEGRAVQRVGDAGALTQFGANLVTLQPGARASLRHWHVTEDEFLTVLSGTLTLRDDHGDTAMGPGECAAFPAGAANGHHMVNTSDAPATFLVVGSRLDDEVAHYSDVDMMVTFEGRKARFTRRNGSPLDPA